MPSGKNPFIRLTEGSVRAADKPALASTLTTLSFSEFLDNASRFASWLRGLDGELLEGVIALNVPPEMEAILVFACFNQGITSCHMPTNLETLASIDCTLVITTNYNLETGSIPKVVVTDEVLQQLAGLSKVEPNQIVEPDSIACIFFSSGTTGLPKAIPVTAAELEIRENFVRAARIRGKYMTSLGLGTFGGFMTMFSQLMNLQTFFVPTTADLNAKLVANWSIDTLFGSPTQLSELVAELDKIAPNLRLREIQGTGLSISAELASRFREKTGALITNAYASTEAGVVAMKTGREDDEAYSGEILPGVCIEVVDHEGLALPEGEVGLLRVKSPGQATRYLNSVTATNSQFVDGWFYPGDTGSKIGDSLFLSGRQGEALNASGVKLEPTSLERCVMGLDGIDDAAVFLFKSPSGVTATGMAVVSNSAINGTLLHDKLFAIFGEAAPKYFFRVKSIPRTDMGKIMRNELAVTFESKLRVG